jgi:hypothetical protein
VQLRRRSTTSVRLSFEQVADLVHGGLPMSAFHHRAWWANDLGGRHVHAAAWLDAGWRVESVDFEARWVTFKQERP